VRLNLVDFASQRPIIRGRARPVKKCGPNYLVDRSNTLNGVAMPRDPRKTRQYFAQAVIQEEDPAKLTYLMHERYSALNDSEEQPTRSF
jgi:hypothetical protein